MNNYNDEILAYRVEEGILESIGATETDMWTDFILND
jgi:hypothetical protein